MSKIKGRYAGKRLSTIISEVNIVKEFQEVDSDLERFQEYLGCSDYIFGVLVDKYDLKQAVIAKNPHEVRENIRDMFNTLEEVVRGAAHRKLSGVIVSGPGGVGKSHTVESVLTDEDVVWNAVSGYTTPVGLYELLYKYADEGSVLVFDDCDSVFQSPQTLNLLKAALDTKPNRKICWETAENRGSDTPRSFIFKGTIIFLTNKVLKGEHFEALMTRVHHLDMTMRPDEVMIRMEDVIEGINHKKCTDEEKQDVLDFMKLNLDRFKTANLNLRTFIKILELRMMSALGWERMAKSMYIK